MYVAATAQVYDLLEKVPHPLCNTMFFNASDVVETDAFPSVRVYTFGVMMNMGYMVNFTGHFNLNSFPFDYQQLNMDVRLNNKHKHHFDLSVHAVLFNRKAFALQVRQMYGYYNATPTARPVYLLYLFYSFILHREINFMRLII